MTTSNKVDTFICDTSVDAPIKLQQVYALNNSERFITTFTTMIIKTAKTIENEFFTFLN